MVTDLLINSALWLSVLLFILAGALIAVFGIRMTHLARDLAVATGVGQAFMGEHRLGYRSLVW